jgi:hypothetical protein
LKQHQRSNRMSFAFLSFTAVFAVLLAVFLSPSKAYAEQISASNVAGFDGCNDGEPAQEWHFVINGLASESDAPPSVHVTWENGAEEDVLLGSFSPGGVAHYTTTTNLNSTVTSATAEIFADFNQFVLSHAPCSTPIPTNTPTGPGAPPPPPPAETATTGVTETVGGQEETPRMTETVGPAEETPVPTETVGEEEETPGLTEIVGGQEESPFTTDGATPAPTDGSVGQLPSTGANPGGNGDSGVIAAAVIALALTGTGLLVRRRSIHERA